MTNDQIAGLVILLCNVVLVICAWVQVREAEK